MKTTLENASIEKKALLERMLELYAYDFSNFTSDDINDQGEYGFKRLLRHHWTGKNPDPFVIKIDGKISGFAMVLEDTKDKTLHELKEFFILKKYRRYGIGKIAAKKIFNRFPGKWILSVLSNNKPAILFWEKVINEYTSGRFKVEKEIGSNKKLFKFKSTVKAR